MCIRDRDTAQLAALDGKSMQNLALALYSEEMHPYYQSGVIPADFLEQVLTQRYPLTAEQVQKSCEELYLPCLLYTSRCV